MLLYYFIANLAAYTQHGPQRLYPKGWQLLGATGCLVLVSTLPPVSVVVGIAVLAPGVLYRLVRLRLVRG